MNNSFSIPNITNVYSLLNNSSNDIKSNGKKRKQRIVKNADVEIDDVCESPGYNYVNWIRITKQKLKVPHFFCVNLYIHISA